jgi:hypothetical protein
MYSLPKKQEKTLIFRDKGFTHGFTQIPNQVLRDSKLSGNDKALYGLLLSYAWANNECFPGHDLLAQNMGVSKRYIIKILNNLKLHNLIDWKRQGLGKANIYYICRITDAYPAIYDNTPKGEA